MTRRAAAAGMLGPEPPRARWAWFLPFGVIVAVFLSFFPPIGGLERLVGISIGLVIIAFASRRPDLALLGLVIGLPFQNFALSQLYQWGIASTTLRPLAAWKEALAAGVVIAGARGFMAARRRADALDLVALGFVAIVALYAFASGLLTPDAPAAGDARSLAFRSTAGFVLLLIGARHVTFPEGFTVRLQRVILAIGVIVASIAVYEFTFSDSWNNFVVNTIRYPFYQVEVLQVTPIGFRDIRYYGHLGGSEFVRVGSVLFSPLDLGFYLVLPFAVAIERTVRQGVRSYSGAALALIGAAVIFTQTRAALIAVVIVAFVALQPAAGRDWSRRVGFSFILVLGLLIAVPAAVATGLSERVTTAASGDEDSAIDHVDAFWQGLRVIGSEPLGLGLGTSAGVGQRFGTEVLVITENYYLQVGVEVGVVGLAVFVVLTVLTLRRLRRAALLSPDLMVTATRSAGLGLAVGAFFLHTWATIAVAWTFWGVAGAMIGIGERETEAEPLAVSGSAER